MSDTRSDSAAGLLHARARLARSAAPFIWQESARRMAERLPLLRLQPERALDVGCAWGDGLALLRRQYPRAQLIGVEPAAALAERARRAQVPPRLLRALRAPTEVRVGALHAPPCVGAQMLWSNLALPWAADVAELFAGWHAALQPDGVLMFTSFGPDTLRELRTPELRELGVRVPDFIDMHDVGDLLIAQGFAEPVMDMEIVRLRYSDGAAALAELATLGRAPHAAAAPGLRTPRSWRLLQQALRGADGAVEISFELIYGHAYRPRTVVARDGIATFAVEQLRGTRALR